MRIVRTFFRVASLGESGTLHIRIGGQAPERARIELDGGWVHALTHSGYKPPRAEDALRGLLGRITDAGDDAEADWAAKELPTKIGRCTPFHPAVVLRNHVEGLIDAVALADARARAEGKRLRLEFAPHASCLGRDERPLVTMLANAPRTLDELLATGFTAHPRIVRLVAFLEAVACVRLEAGATAYALLGLPDGAPHDEVRRAYKRLARALHPDLNAGASDGERRELEARLAQVTAAYKSLLPSG